MKENFVKRKRSPRTSKAFIRYYFGRSSLKYDVQKELEYLSFRNEPDLDMEYLKNKIFKEGALYNKETYKSHYKADKDIYFMDLGQVADRIWHTEEYQRLPLRKD